MKFSKVYNQMILFFNYYFWKPHVPTRLKPFLYHNILIIVE